MKENKQRLFTLLCLGFILVNAACAQNPSFTGKAYVDEEGRAEQSTFLLNNSSYLVPLQNLEQLKRVCRRF
jgi:hypothetical protein